MMSLWDVAAGKALHLPDRVRFGALFSPDGKTLAAPIDVANPEVNEQESVKLFDASSLAERLTIALPKGHISAWPCAFSADGKTLAVRLETGECENDPHFKSILNFYSTKTGEKVASVPADGNGSYLYPVKLSGDGRTLSMASDNLVYLIDMKDYDVQRIGLEGGGNGNPSIPDFAFDRSGRWLAVTTRTIPEDRKGADDLTPEELPQPRIHIVDVSTGKVVETLVAPQCCINSLAFSPDGKTLASSGNGEVLLWDFSILPGESRL